MIPYAIRFAIDLEMLNLHGCNVSISINCNVFFSCQIHYIIRRYRFCSYLINLVILISFYFVSFCVHQNLQDKAVISLAENCKNLQYLCLSGCSHLTDASLIILAQKCHQLSTLEVAGCSQFTDTGFQALARVRFILFQCTTFLRYSLIVNKIYSTSHK